MDLTPEQIQEIVNAIMLKVHKELKQHLDNIPEVDTRNFVTKKFVTDLIDSLKAGLNEEIVKLQEAVKKIAEETDTKIKALTPPKTKPWYATLLDED